MKLQCNNCKIKKTFDYKPAEEAAEIVLDGGQEPPSCKCGAADWSLCNLPKASSIYKTSPKIYKLFAKEVGYV